jgi:accessory colonization factor AcfC
MTKDIGEALIQQALKDTPINSIQFLPNVVIYIGNSGAARDQSSEEPHSDSH